MKALAPTSPRCRFDDMRMSVDQRCHRMVNEPLTNAIVGTRVGSAPVLSTPGEGFCHSRTITAASLAAPALMSSPRALTPIAPVSEGSNREVDPTAGVTVW
jgi:hypothetical protein